jgi:hypothetical protein
MATSEEMTMEMAAETAGEEEDDGDTLVVREGRS